MEDGQQVEGRRQSDESGAVASRAQPNEHQPRRLSMVRGVMITTVAVGLGNLLGLARDLLMAAYFGANGQTDAFLVAWTLPETAVPLLIDGAMTLVMVPVFTRALRDRTSRAARADSPVDPTARPAATTPRDPVVALITATLPKLVIGLVLLAALVMFTAPWLVAALAPGLADPALGATSMRIIAVSIICVGVAGYLASALRSHLVYGPPALITVGMNVGILSVMISLHRSLGVLAAVIGAAIGSAFMVAVQVPAFTRHLGWPRWSGWRWSALLRPGVGFGTKALAPVAVYIMARQGQVFVERFVGSWLHPGTITGLNYVQKIAQVPSTLALSMAVVSFPALSRAIAGGDRAEARGRTLSDVVMISAPVLAATCYLIAFSSRVVGLLLQHGAFTEAEAAAVAGVLRVYVLGLLGQALLDLLCRGLFAGASGTWLPALAMVAGLLLTGGVAAAAAPFWGARAIAAANALGISAAALVVVCVRGGVVPARQIGLALLRLVPATAVSMVAALGVARVMTGLPSLVAVVAGALAVGAVFGGVAAATGGLPLRPLWDQMRGWRRRRRGCGEPAPERPA